MPDAFTMQGGVIPPVLFSTGKYWLCVWKCAAFSNSSTLSKPPLFPPKPWKGFLADDFGIKKINAEIVKRVTQDFVTLLKKRVK